AAESIKIAAISGLVCFLLVFILSGFISRGIFFKPELTRPLKFLSLYIPLGAIVPVYLAILRGYGVIKVKSFADFGTPLVFCFFLGLFHMFLGLSLMNIIYAFVLSVGVLFAATATYEFKRIGSYYTRGKGESFARDVLGFSLPLLIVGVLGVVFGWTDTLMLGRYTNPEDVGVYNVGISIARLLLFPIAALEFVFMPLAGDLYGKSQLSELKKLYQVLTKWIFSATFPIFLILFLFPEMVVTFLFADRFLNAALPLRILSLGFLINAFLGTNSVVMLVMGMSRHLMNIAIFGAILNVLLNYVFIKQMGLSIVGSAVATAFSYFACNIAVSIFLYKKSGVHPITKNYLYPVASTVVITLIIYGIAKSLPLSAWMLPLYFILFIGCYIASFVITRSLDHEDILIFESVSQRTGLEMRLIRKIFYKSTLQK